MMQRLEQFKPNDQERSEVRPPKPIHKHLNLLRLRRVQLPYAAEVCLLPSDDTALLPGCMRFLSLPFLVKFLPCFALLWGIF
jgi:hypothetical protein